VTKDRLSLTEWIVAAILTVVIVGLMVMRWQSPGGIWRDEAACVQLATMPTVGDLWNNFEHEAFPPPFPLLVRGYISLFGSSDFALHGFGFVVGLLLVTSLWGAGSILGHSPPLLSLALVGLNSSFLIWTSVIRGYGLACVTIPLFYACLFQARRTPSRKWILLAILTAVLCVQCTLQNWLLVFAICVSAALTSVIMRDYRTALISLGIGAAGALTVLPYVPRYLSADWRILVKGEATMREYLTALFFNIGAPETVVGTIWIAFILLAVAIAIVALIRNRTESHPEKDALVFGLCVTVLSLAITMEFLHAMNYSARTWYFLPLLTILACNTEMLLGRSLPRRLFRTGRLILVVALAVTLVRPAWYLVQTRLTNIDLVVKTLEEQADPDDLIVSCPWYFGISVQWYYHGPCRHLSVPIIGDQPVHRYDLVATRMKSPDPLGDLREEIEETLRAGRKVWIVGHLRPVPADGPRFYMPAPDPVVGWAEVYYTASWMEQLADFILRHGRRLEEIKVPIKESVALSEEIQLGRITGWKQ